MTKYWNIHAPGKGLKRNLLFSTQTIFVDNERVFLTYKKMTSLAKEKWKENGREVKCSGNL